MQKFTPPGGWGVLLHVIHENRLAIQGAITAFFIVLLFSLWGGEGWKRSLNAGLICGFVALAVVSLFDQLGVADMDWPFVIGAAVGGAVVDRCRSLINAAVTLFSRKKGINDDQR
ncbi:phage holin family protein [Enterobacter ludwigii]|jgi:lambda family phage holin|nr:phage holin family protein [Enterobacter asburiae]